MSYDVKPAVFFSRVDLTEYLKQIRRLCAKAMKVEEGK